MLRLAMNSIHTEMAQLINSAVRNDMRRRANDPDDITAMPEMKHARFVGAGYVPDYSGDNEKHAGRYFALYKARAHVAYDEIEHENRNDANIILFEIVIRDRSVAVMYTGSGYYDNYLFENYCMSFGSISRETCENFAHDVLGMEN